MDKSSILKAFNNHLFEFVDDIITIFPENNDIKTTKTFFEMTKKGNVTLLIKIWFTFVETPYGEEKGHEKERVSPSHPGCT